MGACATKPKAEGAEAPAPEPAKEEAAGAAGLVADSKVEEKDVEVVAVEEDGGDKEIVDEEKVDDEIDRRRSLSHLFKENKEESTNKIEHEQEKLDSLETVIIEEAEKKLPEAEQPCTTQKEETVKDIILSEPSEIKKTIESGPETVTLLVETIEKGTDQETVTLLVETIEKGTDQETVTLIVETIEKGTDQKTVTLIVETIENVQVPNKDEVEKVVEAVVEVEARSIEPNEGKIEAVGSAGKPEIESRAPLQVDVEYEEKEVKVSSEEKI